ncbi:uncharacterized protein VP01_2462g2, partial [Puccinia sorghi]
MVSTRRNRPLLSGPLPPATRSKRPKQTKQYKDLLALPPLPASPEPHPSDSYSEDRPPLSPIPIA